MITKLKEGGGGIKALVVGLLVENFFAASLTVVLVKVLCICWKKFRTFIPTIENKDKLSMNSARKKKNFCTFLCNLSAQEIPYM